MRRFDRSGNSREVSNSSEFGSVTEKEAAGKSFQFTSYEFIKELQKNEIQISMDRRGRYRDNAKMERFWWALKYEDIKIKDYVSLPQLRFGVQHYVNFYNAQRIHSALQYKTPYEVYFGTCNSENRGYISPRLFTPVF